MNEFITKVQELKSNNSAKSSATNGFRLNGGIPVSRLPGTLLLGAVAVYIVWNVQRVAWRAEFDATPADDLRISYTAPFVIAFLAISLAATYRRTFGVPFIGCVATISLIPAIPHLPFIRELGHLAIRGLIIFYLKDVLGKAGIGREVALRLEHMDHSFIFSGAFIIVNGALQSACTAALVALAVVFAGGLVFETQSWVFAWYFLALALVLAREVENAGLRRRRPGTVQTNQKPPAVPSES